MKDNVLKTDKIGGSNIWSIILLIVGDNVRFTEKRLNIPILAASLEGNTFCITSELNAVKSDIITIRNL